MLRPAMLLLLAALAGNALAAKDPARTPLNEWPMIMVHDAATTYLPGGVLHPVNTWAKTQADGGTGGELRCGARGFDWRPKLSGGKLIMHHGSIDVPHDMGAALDEIVSWCGTDGRNATQDLVVLGITDCDGGAACTAAAQAALRARNISYVTDCTELKGMTAAAATARGALPGGGALLATFDCWQENYDPSVACTGFGSKGGGLRGAEATRERELDYTCYADSSTKAMPLNRMWAYVDKVTAAGPPADGQLYTTQCIWQESADSVVVGELHGSSLLEDESRSQLNALLTQRIRSGVWNISRINFVEVNNVCDGGLQLLAALRE